MLGRDGDDIPVPTYRQLHAHVKDSLRRFSKDLLFEPKSTFSTETQRDQAPALTTDQLLGQRISEHVSEGFTLSQVPLAAVVAVVIAHEFAVASLLQLIS